MIKKLKQILNIIPALQVIYLPEKEFNDLKIELLSDDFSCACEEMRFKAVIVRKSK